ncbi:hypothetical protein U8V72_20110 [Priestia filamentosa]|uniref:hypothetical protein n=1 Tax=Priestia filamentosa TaxID=1402861 RepID=UPI00397D26D9
MKTYLVELNYISNEDYKMPSHLKCFKISASNMDKAIENTTNKLGIYMLNKDDYFTEAGEDFEHYVEISFGDSNTGQDVCYSITEVQD